MLRTAQRTVDIVSVVPSLRLVFARAFQTSVPSTAGGKRFDAGPSYRPRPPRSGAVARGRPASAASHNSEHRSYDGGQRSFDRGQRSPNGDHGHSGNPPRTTHRQLAPLPASGSRTWAPPSGRVRPDLHPKSQPFTPETFRSPKVTPEAEAKAMPQPFDNFLMIPKLLDLMHQKYSISGRTTPVQSLAFDYFLPTCPTPARALIGGETGSGKTIAYLVPLYHHLKVTDQKALPQTLRKPLSAEEKKRHQEILLPRSIILSPTHELNRQTTDFAKALCHHVKLSVVGMSDTKFSGVGYRTGSLDVLLGTGNSMRKVLGLNKEWDLEEEDEDPTSRETDKKWWRDKSVQAKAKKGAQVRAKIIDRKAFVGVDNVEWVIVDEADIMLGPNFVAETLSVLNHIHVTRPAVNFVLVTATVPPALLHLLRIDPLLSSMPFVRLLSPAMHKLPQNLEARFVPKSISGTLLDDVAHELRRIIAEDSVARRAKGKAGKWVEKSKIVVFCNSDLKVQQLSKLLDNQGLKNIAWTGHSTVRVRGTNGVLSTFLLPPDTGLKRPLPPKEQQSERVTSSEQEDARPNLVEEEPLSDEDAEEVMSLIIGDGDQHGSGQFELVNGEKLLQELEEMDDEAVLADAELESSGSTALEPNTNASEHVVTSSPAKEDLKSTEESDKPAEGKTPRILITTSLLSRGLDFSPAVSTVVLVDKPKDVLDFVHRAGRAGRAGRPGRVVVFGMGHAKRTGGLEKGVGELVGKGAKARLGGRKA